MSVSWQKLSKNESTQIDKSNKRFWGNTNKELSIESVCKEDEGEYQAVLSIEEDRIRKTIQSNVIFLHVVGGMILLIDINLKRIIRIIIFVKHDSSELLNNCTEKATKYSKKH